MHCYTCFSRGNCQHTQGTDGGNDDDDDDDDDDNDDDDNDDDDDGGGGDGDDDDDDDDDNDDDDGPCNVNPPVIFHWLIDRLIDWLDDWLNEWMNECVIKPCLHVNVPFMFGDWLTVLICHQQSVQVRDLYS